MPRKRRGRRRRNPRTQRPARVINSRTGVGRTTLLETSEWLRVRRLVGTCRRLGDAGSGPHEAEAAAGRSRRGRRYISRAETSEGNRGPRRGGRKYRKPHRKPLHPNLPGMSGRVRVTGHTQATRHISRGTAAVAGWQVSGIPPQPWTPGVARAHPIPCRTAGPDGQSYRRIAAERRRDPPEATVRHWLKSGRAEAVSADIGE